MSQPSPKKPLDQFAKYSGLSIQMGVVIGLGTWLGVKGDEYFQFNDVPVLTIVGALTGVFASLYVFIKGLTNE